MPPGARRNVGESVSEPARPGVARGWWRTRRRRLLGLWGAGILASVVVTGASSIGYLERLQARALDLLLLLGGQRFPADVVVVAIDDATFMMLEERQPIPRQHLARVIRGLQRSGAAAVGLDINLGAATSAVDDAALREAMAEFSREGLSQVIALDGPPPASGPLATPGSGPPIARGSDRVPVDPDGVIRRAAFAVPGPRGPLPALAVAVLARAAGQDPQALLERAARREDGLVALPAWKPDGSWEPEGAAVPLRPGELWRINFVGPEKSVLTVPSRAVAALGEPGASVAADNPFRGRIVLVGATFWDSRDFFQTPVGRLPGVEVHANLVHMLALRQMIRPAGWLIGLALQLGIVVVAGLLLVALRPLLGTLAALVLTLLVGVPGSYFAFHGGGYAVDFILPVVVTCLLGVVAHVNARRRLRESLGRYVGRDVLAQILAENPGLSGERREVSILVSDIRGFTTLSEKLPAEVVAAHLNDYFPAMVGAIFDHRGTVDDFIGDGILAVFGAPLPDADHAGRAVRAAAAMQAALTRLNAGWEGRGLPVLRMGVAVHTGTVFVGNVGSAERAKYTVIGDAVNATARLEGLNKDLGTTILLTEEVRTAVGGLVETRFRGDIAVKGRAEPLRVHELVKLRLDSAGDGGGRE
jgi:adenylate cyclase